MQPQKIASRPLGVFTGNARKEALVVERMYATSRVHAREEDQEPAATLPLM